MGEFRSTEETLMAIGEQLMTMNEHLARISESLETIAKKGIYTQEKV